MCLQCDDPQDRYDAIDQNYDARIRATIAVAQRVQRWDVYDIADELADVPGMLREAIYDPRIVSVVAEKVKQLEARLWAAADRGGKVGPAPEYRQGGSTREELFNSWLENEEV